jgi:hypothetical protein
VHVVAFLVCTKHPRKRPYLNYPQIQKRLLAKKHPCDNSEKLDTGSFGRSKKFRNQRAYAGKYPRMKGFRMTRTDILCTGRLSNALFMSPLISKLFCTNFCMGGRRGERDIVNSLRPAREWGGVVMGQSEFTLPPSQLYREDLRAAVQLGA